MADGDQIQGLPPGAIVKPIQGLPPGAIVKPIGGGNSAPPPAPRTTYHSNPSFADYAPPNAPARTVAQTPAEKERQDTVLPYIHNPDAAPNASLFKYGFGAIPLALGVGGAIEEGGLNAPTLLKIGRGIIGSAAGAYGGEKVGSGVGGLFGDTGRQVGGTLGALGGGALGGTWAADLEREPATSLMSRRGVPGRISPLPFGIQRAIPEWMVPEGELGSPTNPGPYMDIPGRMPKIGSGGGGGQPLLGAAEQGPLVVPEPRTPFEGETPNYMASVPRDELERLAQSAKPGAGKQLQQLGRPILYRPKGYFGDE